MVKKYFLLLLLTSFAQAQETNWRAFYIESPRQQFAWQPAPAQQDLTVARTGTLSGKMAFMFSAIVPGAGQGYAGSWLKALGFAAIEAAGWAMYYKYDKQGADIDAEFHVYADAHWSEDEYWDRIADLSQLDRNNVEALRDWERTQYSHGLHREKDQQYYEMIGKYDQFNSAWDDSDRDIKDDGWNVSMRSAHRLWYEDRRKDSNDAYKNSTTMGTIVILNHILSAADAAWTVSRHNKTLAQASLHMQPLRTGDYYCSAVNLRVTW